MDEIRTEINLNFKCLDIAEETLETLLQHLQEDAILYGGMIYSITKIKDVLNVGGVKNERKD